MLFVDFDSIKKKISAINKFLTDKTKYFSYMYNLHLPTSLKTVKFH